MDIFLAHCRIMCQAFYSGVSQFFISRLLYPFAATEFVAFRAPTPHFALNST